MLEKQNEEETSESRDIAFRISDTREARMTGGVFHNVWTMSCKDAAEDMNFGIFMYFKARLAVLGVACTQ